MIKKIRVKNFKCYGPQGADFNLSKVNFIYGDNSVGKSSFLQFLEQFAKQIDYKNQYDRKFFDRHSFKGQGNVSARVRAVTEKLNVPMTYELTFQPSQDNEFYETIVKDGAKISSEFWDSILPKNDGKERIVHWPVRKANDGEDIKSTPDKSDAGLAGAAFANVIGIDKSGASEYLNDMFSRMGIRYSCVEEQDSAVSRKKIHDQDFGIDVPLSQVGQGIQQLVDLAFTLRDWHAGMLALEEPESNVDESQLGALTRILVEESLKRPQGQLIVECHSKLMVQKLAALVKEGVIPATNVENGLRVMVVSKQGCGSRVDDAEIDARGRIEWPTAFFGSEGEILRSMYGVGK